MNYKVKKKDSGIDQVLNQPMPKNIDAEQGLLSAFLIDPATIYEAVEHLSEDDWYSESHRQVYQAMMRLIDKNQPVDLITVTEALHKHGTLNQIGTGTMKGATYLSWLTDSVPLAANVPHYAKIVHDKAIARRLIEGGFSIVKRAMAGHDDAVDLLDWSENQIFQIAHQKSQGKFRSIGTLIDATLDDLELRQKRNSKITGVPSGFDRLDKLTAGFQPSDLIILAARPSMGKTALALNIARNAAVDQNIPVGIFSLEMSQDQLSARILSCEARVPSERIRTGFLSQEDWTHIGQATDILGLSPIFIDDTPAISAIETRAKARRLKAEKNIGLLIIDYLQLMRSSAKNERREQEIADISRSLKALAKELNIPVIALSQLNRKVEERGDKRPMLSDLRESGALEQDADVVAFIYRDEVYNKDENNPNRGKAEIIVGKHRNGPIGTAYLAFSKKYTRFENIQVE